MSDLLNITMGELAAQMPAKSQLPKTDEILDITIPQRGKAAEAIEVVFVREITQEDIYYLATYEGSVAERQTLKKIRDSHHWLARCLAQGMDHYEASAKTGYSPETIALLKNDPTFNELLGHYQEQAREMWGDILERMKYLSLDAVNELQDRLREEPEGFSNTLLLNIMEKTADRTGAGPSSKLAIDQTLRVDPKTIDQIKEIVDGQARGQIRRVDTQSIDVEFTREKENNEQAVVSQGGQAHS